MWDAAAEHVALHVKGEKTNMGKYQQFVHSGIRNKKLFSLKGLLYRYAAHALGHRVHCGGGKKDKGKVAPAPVVLEGKATLAQTAMLGEDLSLSCANQLEKASTVYSDTARLHKHNIIISVMQLTMQLHFKQNRLLREHGAAITFETSMMKGEMYHVPRMLMARFRSPRYFVDCGVETEWRPQSICYNSGRIQYSNYFLGVLFDLSLAVVKQHVARFLPFPHGWPKRSVLWLDSELGPPAVEEFHNDYRIYFELEAVDAEWSQPFVKRSVFKKMAVLQLLYCLQLDKWQITERSFLTYV